MSGDLVIAAVCTAHKSAMNNKVNVLVKFWGRQSLGKSHSGVFSKTSWGQLQPPSRWAKGQAYIHPPRPQLGVARLLQRVLKRWL